MFWINSKEKKYPDVIAKSNKRIDIFSIETNENININSKVDKWKMFSVFATANKGCFYIVGRKPIIEKIQDKIDDRVSSVNFLEIV